MNDGNSKMNLCKHCREVKPVFVIRGWHKCRDCLEIIDRIFWDVACIEPKVMQRWKKEQDKDE